MTNSISTSGSESVTGIWRYYVDADFYYQCYESKPLGRCNNLHTTQFVVAESNAGKEPNASPVNPWRDGQCYNDYEGIYIGIQVGAQWDADHSSAVSYTAGGDMFGIGVYAKTGYTSNIHINFDNPVGQVKDVCGVGALVAQLRAGGGPKGRTSPSGRGSGPGPRDRCGRRC